MYEEILDLYDDYCSNMRFADNQFVNQIFIIINKYHNLGNYLKEVYVTKDKDSEYSSVDKTIDISLVSVFRTFKKLRKKMKKEDYIYLHNIVVIEIIFHELEHIYQEEVKFSTMNNLEQLLLLFSDPLIVIDTLRTRPNFIEQIKISSQLRRHRKFYNKNHNSAPHERIANIRSYRNIIALLDCYEPDQKGLDIYYQIVTNLINKQLRHGYVLIGDKTNSPSLDYLLHTESIRDYIIDNPNIFDNDGISKEDRILYGLSLKESDYNVLLKGTEEGKDEYCR